MCFYSYLLISGIFHYWRGKDSNLRRRKPSDLQSDPFGRSGTPPQIEPEFCLMLMVMSIASWDQFFYSGSICIVRILIDYFFNVSKINLSEDKDKNSVVIAVSIHYLNGPLIINRAQGNDRRQPQQHVLLC